MSSEDDLQSFLASTRLMQGMAASSVARVARQVSSRRLDPGDTIYHRGKGAALVYAVRAGYLKMSTGAVGGSRFVLEVFGPGQWVGMAPVLARQPRSFDLEALAPAEVIVLAGRVLEDLLATNARFARNLAGIFAERCMVATDEVHARSVLGLETKLARQLARLLDAHGETGPGGEVSLPFQLSQEVLGEMIGATRQAVGRCLGGWEQEGWVDLGYRTLVVRRPRRLIACAGLESARAAGAAASVSGHRDSASETL